METLKPFNTDLINPTQEQNLRNLVNLLLSGDKRLEFSTVKFTKANCVGALEETYCNSIGCVIDWNTLLIPKKDGQDYYEYSEEHLISNCFSKEWIWCFSLDWTTVNNTKEGAAKRILYLLEKGLPKNCISIMEGEAPLPY